MYTSKYYADAPQVTMRGEPRPIRCLDKRGRASVTAHVHYCVTDMCEASRCCPCRRGCGGGVPRPGADVAGVSPRWG